MRGSNLHAVWDSGLIKSLNLDNASIVNHSAAGHRAVCWSPPALTLSHSDSLA